MGADLLVAAIARHKDSNLDWDAGLAALVNTPEADLHSNQPEEFYEEGQSVKTNLQACIETLREAFEHGSRELADIEIGPYFVYITGGMSHGDDPTDLFDPMCELLLNPGLMKAIGFTTFLDLHEPDEDTARTVCTECGAVAEKCMFCKDDARHMIAAKDVPDPKDVFLCDTHVMPYQVALECTEVDIGEEDLKQDLWYDEIGAYLACEHLDTW